MSEDKIKNTRLVKFLEDYVSTAEKNGAAKEKREPVPIYKKGSIHAIHYLTVKSLKEKGAKMEVKPFDPAPGIKRLQVERKKNLENA